MKPVDVYAAAMSAKVRPDRIRKWASRGKLEAVGRDHRGRTLYDLDAVMEVAATLRRFNRDCEAGDALSQ